MEGVWATARGDMIYQGSERLCEASAHERRAELKR